MIIRVIERDNTPSLGQVVGIFNLSEAEYPQVVEFRTPPNAEWPNALKQRTFLLEIVPESFHREVSPE